MCGQTAIDYTLLEFVEFEVSCSLEQLDKMRLMFLDRAIFKTLIANSLLYKAVVGLDSKHWGRCSGFGWETCRLEVKRDEGTGERYVVVLKVDSLSSLGSKLDNKLAVDSKD